MTRRDETTALILIGITIGLGLAAFWHGVTVAEDRIEYQSGSTIIQQ